MGRILKSKRKGRSQADRMDLPLAAPYLWIVQTVMSAV